MHGRTGELVSKQCACVFSVGKMAVMGGNARSMQWNSFRKNATNFFTSVARLVRGSAFKMNRCPRDEM